MSGCQTLGSVVGCAGLLIAKYGRLAWRSAGGVGSEAAAGSRRPRNKTSLARVRPIRLPGQGDWPNWRPEAAMRRPSQQRGHSVSY